MSIGLDSTDAISRAANIPTRTAFTIAAWIYFNALPAGDRAVFGLHTSANAQLASLRWDTSSNAMRMTSSNYGTDWSSNPGTGVWVYIYLRSSATNTQSGWKTVEETSFSAAKQKSQTVEPSGTATKLHVGGHPTVTTSADMLVHRLSVWDEAVTDANLLLAAATDLGYGQAGALNTHLPLYAQIASPYADTSGNARDWTETGTIAQDQADPVLASAGVPKSTKLTLLGVG